jgi:uroporphyrinogen-III synthase
MSTQVGVALFRGRKDASATAAWLRRLGFSVASPPAIEIEAKPVRPQRSHYDAVIATSDKAFHADGPLDTSAPYDIKQQYTTFCAVAEKGA